MIAAVMNPYTLHPFLPTITQPCRSPTFHTIKKFIPTNIKLSRWLSYSAKWNNSNLVLLLRDF